MIGETISHYKILEKLGEGGMGVVYKAEDTKLRRSVALKFLHPRATESPDETARFLREAQAAAALDHPNICTVYEVGEARGQTYISMAYIEGKSLREKISSGPIPLEEALDIAIQTAEGLRAAHKKGIVHRDIKSANLMLTPEGTVKVMDFGLAKTAGATKMTATGTTVGTAAYMSPEQAVGQAVDLRSDIWSMGVVLFEMLMGRLPFEGDYDAVLLYAIVNEKQDPLTQIDSGIPLEVEQLVNRTLEKQPGKRYQETKELVENLEDLREGLDLLPRRSRLHLKLLRRRRKIISSIAATAVVIAVVAVGIWYFSGSARGIDSIAVLPFENLSADSGQNPLIEGMTMELTATLGQTSGFEKVMPYSVMKRYRETDKSIGDIAQRIDVKVLVAGTVNLEGDRIKMIVEMIEGGSERLLWTREFEFGEHEIKNMMSDIVNGILARAGVDLSPENEAFISRVRSDNSEAYMAYLRGRALALSYSEENLIKGIEMLEYAVQLDSMFALAYVELSSSYSSYGMMYSLGREEYPKVKYAALRALEIDDGLADAHMALAVMKATFEWDWKSAEQSFKRAIKLGPENADVHREYANYLAFMTRFEEALEEAQMAIDIDPITLVNQQTLGWILYHAGRFDESIAQFEKILVLLEEFPNSAKEMQIGKQIIWNYMYKGMYDKALIEINAWEEKWEDRSKNLHCDSERARIYVAIGRRDEVEELIEEILSRDVVMPNVADELGDRELAFRMFEKLYETKNTYMIFTKMAIELEGLRSDPRYDDLLRRLNFIE